MARPSAALMMQVRQLHTYVGAFIAPSVLFFAFTGSLQLFSLHESHGAYAPPPVVEMLGRIHKDQVTRSKPHAAAAPHHHDADHDVDHHDHAAATPWSVMALKWLFLTAAVGLITSTLLGLWMSLALSRHKRVVVGLLVVGAALPVLLLALQP
jgi:hypothetical protein